MFEIFYKNLYLVFIFYTLSFLFLKNSFITQLSIDKDFVKPQSFHRKAIPRFGGLILIVTYFIFFLINNSIFSSEDLLILTVFSLVNFILGFLDDIKLLKKPIIKFIFFLISNFFLIYFFEIKINNFNFLIFDYLNKKYLLFSILLTLLAIFFIVNGSNLVDGFNGLLTLNIIIILLNYLILYKLNNIDPNVYIIVLLILSICFLSVNFPKATIFLGDGGAYFLGSQIAILTIAMSNSIDGISSFYYACILFYLFFEIFFSVFRKIFQKKNPFNPDEYHLHMLIYYYLNKKIDFKISNPLCSILINIFFLIITLPLNLISSNNLACIIYFIFFIFVYLFSYYFFLKNTKYR